MTRKGMGLARARKSRFSDMRKSALTHSAYAPICASAGFKLRRRIIASQSGAGSSPNAKMYSLLSRTSRSKPFLKKLVPGFLDLRYDFVPRHAFEHPAVLVLIGKRFLRDFSRRHGIGLSTIGYVGPVTNRYVPHAQTVLNPSGQVKFNAARGVWTNASSRSYKENFDELSDTEAAQTVRALTPLKYNYKSDKDEHHVGFIACLPAGRPRMCRILSRRRTEKD